MVLTAYFVAVAGAMATPDPLSLEPRLERLSQEISRTSELFEYRGRWAEARHLLTTGLAILEPSGTYPTSEARILTRLAAIDRLELHFDDALERVQLAHALAVRGGNPEVLGDCLFQWGYVLDHQEGFGGGSDLVEVRRLYEESLRVRREAGDLRGQAFSLFRLGRLIEMEGDDAKATEMYGQVLALHSGERFPVAANYANSHLGFIAERADRLDEALAHFEEGLRIKQEIRFDSNLPFAYIHLGRVHEKLGHVEQAADFFRQSISFSQERGLPRTLPLGYLYLGTLQRRQGDHAEAERNLRQSLAQAERHEIMAWSAETWLGLGRLLSETDRRDEAMAAFQEARAHLQQQGREADVEEVERVIRQLRTTERPPG